MREIPVANKEPLLQESSLHSTAVASSGNRPGELDTTKRNSTNYNINNNKRWGIKMQLLGMMNSSRLLCLVMMLDLMIVSVQIPSLPSVFDGHGMDLRWQGWVSSLYGIMSFFIAPVLARASDSLGRVSMLQVSAIGSLAGALGSLYATEKWSFIAARTLPGLLKCSLPISQAYIVDVSEGPAERSKNLGMLGASFGMSFVVGPPLGGLAADYDASYPFLLAVILSISLLGIIHFVLPEPPTKVSKPKSREAHEATDGEGAAAAAAAGKSSISRLSLFRGSGGVRMAWGFHDRFWVVVAEGLHHTSLAPFLTKVLGFPAARIGFLLSYMGLVSALTNAFLVGALSRRFSEQRLMVAALFALGAGWTMWSSVSGSTQSLLVALAMVGAGGNLFQTVNKAAVAQHAPPELVGTVMGMSGAMETFGRTISGPLSGYLFLALGARGIPRGCACVAFYVALVLTLRGTTLISRGETSVVSSVDAREGDARRSSIGEVRVDDPKSD